MTEVCSSFTAQYILHATGCVTEVQWFNSEYKQQNFLHSEVQLILAVRHNLFPMQVYFVFWTVHFQ